jgi:hydroxymethylbilane synthase
VKPLRLATRGSALALTQSKMMAAALEAAHPGLKVELSVMKSMGDQKADLPLSGAGGVGLFTKELEQALQRGDADLAVHSLKDLPTQLAPGLVLAAIPQREDWRDAWLSAASSSPWDLPFGALVGTGSPRRRAQLGVKRPDLQFVEFRGNVDTRLAKLERGEVSGAVLALAGLNRLGLQAKAARLFSEEEMLPAPGQGFLALETKDKGEAFELCRALNEATAFAEAACERALLARLEAGCHAPVAALARTNGSQMHLKAFVAMGPKPLHLEVEGPAADAAALGWKLAEQALG